MMVSLDLGFALNRALLGLVGLFVVKQVYDYFTVGAARRHLIKENGCKPIKSYPHKDPIFGFDLLSLNIKAIRQGNFLENSRKRFGELGATYRLKLAGSSCKAIGFLFQDRS